MEKLKKCTKNGADGWKCGADGTCFTGVDAKQEAFREMGEKKGKKYSLNPKKSTVDFLKKHKLRKENLKK
jgi:hypothetical protein